jgi:hypothetical protein
MAGLIAWLVRGIQWGGPAAIGYFINDLGAWVARTTNTDSKVRESSGGFKAWFIAAVAIAAGIVAYMISKILSGKRKF